MSLPPFYRGPDDEVTRTEADLRREEALASLRRTKAARKEKAEEALFAARRDVDLARQKRAERAQEKKEERAAKEEERDYQESQKPSAAFGVFSSVAGRQRSTAPGRVTANILDAGELVIVVGGAAFLGYLAWNAWKFYRVATEAPATAAAWTLGSILLPPGGPAVALAAKDRIFGSAPDAARDSWYDAMGSDLYNPAGVARPAAKKLDLNARRLAAKFGKFSAYFGSLSPEDQRFLYYVDSSGEPAVSPYSVRQHLAELPFSEDLVDTYNPDVIAPGGAAALQAYVWTDWDRVPGWLAEGKIESARAQLKASLSADNGFSVGGDRRHYAISRNRTWAIGLLVSAWQDAKDAEDRDRSLEEKEKLAREKEARRAAQAAADAAAEAALASQEAAEEVARRVLQAAALAHQKEVKEEARKAAQAAAASAAAALASQRAAKEAAEEEDREKREAFATAARGAFASVVRSVDRALDDERQAQLAAEAAAEKKEEADKKKREAFGSAFGSVVADAQKAAEGASAAYLAHQKAAQREEEEKRDAFATAVRGVFASAIRSVDRALDDEHQAQVEKEEEERLLAEEHRERLEKEEREKKEREEKEQADKQGARLPGGGIWSGGSSSRQRR